MTTAKAVPQKGAGKRPQTTPSRPTRVDLASEKLIHYCDLVIEWGLVLIAFLVPLIFTTSTGADIFNLPRLTFMRVATVFVAMAWVLRLLESREYYRLRTPMLWPTVAVLLSWLVSSIFSLRPEVSFLGNYLRQEGFWTIANVILLFFIASSSLRTAKQVNQILMALMWSGFFACLYGLIQFFGWDWIGWGSSGRPFSTLGNPDFFPHFLIMLLPVAIMKFLHSPRLELKIYQLIYIALLAFNVVVAQTRGSYIGLIIALPVLACFVGRKTYRDNKWWLIGLGVAFVALVAFLIVKMDFLGSILRGGLQQTRFYIWLGGLAIVAGYPILGVGPDVLRIASPPFKNIMYSLLEPMNNPDRMHNQYLDEMIMRGAIGFLIYMWSLVTFFVASFRAWKKTINPYWKGMIAGIAVGVLACLAQNLVAFGVLPTILTFWLLAGLNMALWQMDFTPPAEARGKKPSKQIQDVDAFGEVPSRKVPAPLPVLTKRLIIVLSALVLIINAFYAFRILDADLAYGAGEIQLRTAQAFGEQAANEQDPTRKEQIQAEASRLAESALGNYQRAVDLNPVEAGYRTATEGHTSGLGNLLYQFAMSQTDTINRDNLRDQARAQWQAALRTTMYLENVYMQFGRSYLDEANEKPAQRNEFLSKAAEYFELGAKSDPGDYPLYFNLAQIYSELGDYPKAITNAEMGIKYTSDVAGNATNKDATLLGAQTYLNQAVSLAQAGKTEEAQPYLQKAKGYAERTLQLDPENAGAKDILSRVNSALGIVEPVPQPLPEPTPAPVAPTP